MYKDTLKVANKIISYDDLIDIFSKMNEELEKYKKIYKNEELRNKPLERNYQVWTFKDTNSGLTFRINFYDDTEIKFDNYNNFITIFNTRLEEIKSIDVIYNLDYSTFSQKEGSNYHHQSILMYIYEKKMDIKLSLESNDEKVNEVYELIKSKILNAPEKYDDLIKKKSSIISTIGISIGFIPSIIICTLLAFIPTIRLIFSESYVLYPIFSIVLAYLFGSTIGINKMHDLYINIIPDKKYVNYNVGYKDDIDKYIDTSEILIGKNVHNLENRKVIMNEYNKYKKLIPYEIIALIIFSVLIIIIGKII
jgi:hypothetical protein